MSRNKKRKKSDAPFFEKESGAKSRSLRKRPDEDDESFFARLKKQGWLDPDKVEHHWSVADSLNLHSGEESKCFICNKKAKVSPETVEKSDTEVSTEAGEDENVEKESTEDSSPPPSSDNNDSEFVWNEIQNIDSIKDIILKTPKGMHSVFYMAVGDEDKHMTILYVECGIGLATALTVVTEKYLKKVKVRFTNHKLDFVPDKDVYEVKVRLPGGLRDLIKKIAIRDFVPHVTTDQPEDFEGVIKRYILYSPYDRYILGSEKSFIRELK
jgi:hypothetical protein